MNLEDQIAALTVLKNKVEDELSARKKQWADGARPKQRDAAMIGEEELGTITMTKGRESWRVTDPAAVVAWAQEHAPHLVEYSAHIPDGHLVALKRNPVTEDGEIIPGFDLVVGDPYPSVRLASGAERVISEAVQSGRLRLLMNGGALEVGGGDDATHDADPE